MKSIIFLIVFLNFSIFLNAQVSIYDIQFTQNAADGTYPSEYEDQQVTTGGIVTAIDLENNYYIAASPGGPWSGLFIYDHTYGSMLHVGDSIVVSGTVSEYYGLTEIKDITMLEVKSSGNILPEPVAVSTSQVTSDEAYESVYVTTNNVNVVSDFNNYYEWEINDGTGVCPVASEIFDLNALNFPLIYDFPFSKVAGIVKYSWGAFQLNVTKLSDITSSEEVYLLSVNDSVYTNGSELYIPLNFYYLNREVDVQQFSVSLLFDEEYLDFQGIVTDGAFSESGTLTESTEGNQVDISFTGNSPLSGIGKLCYLKLVPLRSGITAIDIQSAQINGNDVEFVKSENIELNISPIAIGDTLTVIQLPLMNIPSIVSPGESIEVICDAPEATTNWVFQLLHEAKSIDVSIASSEYDAASSVWRFQLQAPEPQIYELYDLRVAASNNIDDVSYNSVQLIEEEEESFYFVHITDAHLISHDFWSDGLDPNDTSEMIDLYEVIKDINIINPAFVLNTGDLINEGELEDFENRRYFTRTQELLYAFEVPHYLVSGNHDIGGWTSTPPEKGTARKDWWRFFGWKWLNDASVNGYGYTQDYHFNYGGVHFIGLEAYDNYDSFKYEIYGATSFISSQLEWLNQTIAQNDANEPNVVFYHYDFKEELDLEEIGIDMALYGHIHQDRGSLSSYPYNIATDNVCDGARSYRVIKVENGILNPLPTITAGATGNRLFIAFSQDNDGTNDSLSATVKNNNNIAFDNGRVKFVMPKSDSGYDVENGQLIQVDNSGAYAICYVQCAIPASDEITVAIAVKEATGLSGKSTRENEIKCFPNPFTASLQIALEVDYPQTISFYITDVSGRRITKVSHRECYKGSNTIHWDGSDGFGNDVKSGNYFLNIIFEDGIKTTKQLIKQ